MTWELSRRPARWKCNGGEDASYLQLDEKTPEASLQLGIERMYLLRSIGGRGWYLDFGLGGLVSEIPLCESIRSNLLGKNEKEQYLVGSFGGALSFRT